MKNLSLTIDLITNFFKDFFQTKTYNFGVDIAASGGGFTSVSAVGKVSAASVDSAVGSAKVITLVFVLLAFVYFGFIRKNKNNTDNQTMPFCCTCLGWMLMIYLSGGKHISSQMANPGMVFILIIFLTALFAFIARVLDEIKDGKKGKLYNFKYIMLAVNMALCLLVWLPNSEKKSSRIKIPPTTRSWSENQKICYSNIRRIHNAVEAYNKKNPEIMTELDVDLLVAKGYLNSVPVCPEYSNARYKSIWNLYEGGEVSCGLIVDKKTERSFGFCHGSISGKTWQRLKDEYIIKNRQRR